MFAAMAALLVAALCVPEAFDDAGRCLRGRLRRRARRPHRAVRRSPAATTPALRRSVVGLAVEHGDRRRRCSSARRSPTARCRARSGASRSRSTWAARTSSASEGWKLVPGPLRRAPRADHHHRARRVDRRDRRRRRGRRRRRRGRRRRARRRRGRRAVVAVLRRRRARRRAAARATRDRGASSNEIARDSYSYLHFPMVAGHRARRARAEEDARRTSTSRSKLVPAIALLGGTALYLLAHVAFRWRNVHRFSRQRLVAAVVLRRAASRPPSSCPRSRRSRILAALLAVADRLRGASASPSCARGCATSSPTHH